MFIHPKRKLVDIILFSHFQSPFRLLCFRSDMESDRPCQQKEVHLISLQDPRTPSTRTSAAESAPSADASSRRPCSPRALPRRASRRRNRAAPSPLIGPICCVSAAPSRVVKEAGGRSSARAREARLSREGKSFRRSAAANSRETAHKKRVCTCRHTYVLTHALAHTHTYACTFTRTHEELFHGIPFPCH